MRGHPIPPEDVEEIKRLKAEGLKQYEIAEITGWCRATVSRVINDRVSTPRKKPTGEIRPCIKCGEPFLSWDRKLNQICNKCTKDNQWVNDNYDLDTYSLAGAWL